MKERYNFMMLIGIPGSGKSTFCKTAGPSAAPRHVISLDRLIEESMSGGETYGEAFLRVQQTGDLKRFDKAMFDHARDIGTNLNIPVNATDKMPKVVVWDQTNLTVKTRARKLSLFPSEHWSRTAVVFNLSPEEWWRRYEKRAAEEGKTIPKHVIKGMQDSFQMPTFEEGFDHICEFGDDDE